MAKTVGKLWALSDIGRIAAVVSGIADDYRSAGFFKIRRQIFQSKYFQLLGSAEANVFSTTGDRLNQMIVKRRGTGRVINEVGSSKLKIFRVASIASILLIDTY